MIFLKMVIKIGLALPLFFVGFIWDVPEYSILSKIDISYVVIFPSLYCVISAFMDCDMWLSNRELEDMGRVFQLIYKLLNLAIEVYLPLTGIGVLTIFLL
jgi:hypothetical protein